MLLFFQNKEIRLKNTDGTRSDSNLDAYMNLAESHFAPAVSPTGYPRSLEFRFLWNIGSCLRDRKASHAQNIAIFFDPNIFLSFLLSSIPKSWGKKMLYCSLNHSIKTKVKLSLAVIRDIPPRKGMDEWSYRRGWVVSFTARQPYSRERGWGAPQPVWTLRLIRQGLSCPCA
jgi:hypothetical protein